MYFSIIVSVRKIKQLQAKIKKLEGELFRIKKQNGLQQKIIHDLMVGKGNGK